MLANYTLQTCLQLKIKWPRWLMFDILDETHDAWGFHDQDNIHNGKKLINLLDSPMKFL